MICLEILQENYYNPFQEYQKYLSENCILSTIL